MVYNNAAYITTKDGYFPLARDSADFYYTGTVKRISVGAAMMFGLMGAMLTYHSHELGVFKMDHINGGFLFQGHAKTKVL